MSDGLTVMGELTDLSARLDKARRELYRLREELAPVVERWDDVWNDLLVSLVEDYKDSGERLPGEDVRNAMVTKRFREQEPILFGQRRRIESEIDRVDRRAKHLQDEISARQSILSYLRTEAQAVGA
jgi:hypothetical protein